MYSCTLPSTSALDEGGWSTPRPGPYTTEKETWYPLYWRLGGLQGPCGQVRKISPPTGIRFPDRPARRKVNPYGSLRSVRGAVLQLLLFVTGTWKIGDWMDNLANGLLNLHSKSPTGTGFVGD